MFSIIAGGLYLATPLAVDAVVNSIAFGGEQQVYVQALVILSVALLALLGLLALIRAAQAIVMEQIQCRIFVRMTADLAFRLPRVQMEALDRRQGPELVNRFFDVVVLQKSAASLLLDGVNVLFSTLMGLLVLGIYHPMLLSFALGLLLLIAGVVLLPARRGVRTSIQESYAKHAVVGWLEQIVMFPLLFRTRGGGGAGLPPRGPPRPGLFGRPPFAFPGAHEPGGGPVDHSGGGQCGAADAGWLAGAEGGADIGPVGGQ